MRVETANRNTPSVYVPAKMLSLPSGIVIGTSRITAEQIDSLDNVDDLFALAQWALNECERDNHLGFRRCMAYIVRGAIGRVRRLTSGGARA